MQVPMLTSTDSIEPEKRKSAVLPLQTPRTLHSTKTPEMYNSAATSFLSRKIIAPGQQTIVNLFLLMASPVTADTNTTATIKERVAVSGYRISLGLVEISALATLIGASNAEAMALGLTAAAGLPWAPVSTFGAVHVVKVSLAAVVSDRIREALGLRNDAVDSALGMGLEIDPTRAAHRSINSEDPCAILIPYTDHDIDHDTFYEPKETQGTSVKVLEREEGRRPQSVYALEKNTSIILSNLPTTSATEDLKIYQYSHDRGPAGLHNTSNDRIVLFASVLKLAEVYALWQAGATTIWWITAIAWGHGFLAACILQLLGLSRDSSKLGQVDIVTGELPSPLLPGGSRKVLLGLPCNVRRHYMWRIFWGTGTIINCAAILGTFLSLGAQSIEIVYIWVGFQIFWLLMRTLVYNFLAVGHARRSIMVSRSWETATMSVKRRLVNLMMGLAKQQITVHPRGALAYQEDLVKATEIIELYKSAGYKLLEALPLAKISKNQSTNINIIGIVGDTVLRSSIWFQGVSDLSPDLYDCVLVFVEISGSVFAVPGVRVLSGLPLGDVEDRVSSFEPRGTSNNGSQISWEYWIPAKDDIIGQCWLEARGMKIKEAKTAISTQKELQTKLQGGGLNISLSQVAEVERILEESRKAAKALMGFLSDAELNIVSEKQYSKI